MADYNNNRSGRSNTGLAFIVGALVVLVLVLGYYVFFGPGAASDDVVIRIDGGGAALDGAAQAVGDAANRVEGAVRGN
ncbi:MAG: hypothetical protein ACK4GT_04185 [Pararhodobacter sp.]